MKVESGDEYLPTIDGKRNEKTPVPRQSPALGLLKKAPVGVEPTMADLQSAALATWLRSHVCDCTRFCGTLQGHLGGDKPDPNLPANAEEFQPLTQVASVPQAGRSDQAHSGFFATVPLRLLVASIPGPAE